MFSDAIDFYRRNPAVLVAALVVGAGVIALVLTDGNGIDIGELLAVIGVGVILGVVVQVVRGGSS